MACHVEILTIYNNSWQSEENEKCNTTALKTEEPTLAAPSTLFTNMRSSDYHGCNTYCNHVINTHLTKFHIINPYCKNAMDELFTENSIVQH